MVVVDSFRVRGIWGAGSGFGMVGGAFTVGEDTALSKTSAGLTRGPFLFRIPSPDRWDVGVFGSLKVPRN